MRDTIIRGFSFNMVPIDKDDGDEGKQINIFEKDSRGEVINVIRLPFDAGSCDYLAEHLDMNNEELQMVVDKAEADRAAQAAKNALGAATS